MRYHVCWFRYSQQCGSIQVQCTYIAKTDSTAIVSGITLGIMWRIKQLITYNNNNKFTSTCDSPSPAYSALGVVPESILKYYTVRYSYKVSLQVFLTAILDDLPLPWAPAPQELVVSHCLSTRGTWITEINNTTSTYIQGPHWGYDALRDFIDVQYQHTDKRGLSYYLSVCNVRPSHVWQTVGRTLSEFLRGWVKVGLGPVSDRMPLF